MGSAFACVKAVCVTSSLLPLGEGAPHPRRHAPCPSSLGSHLTSLILCPRAHISTYCVTFSHRRPIMIVMFRKRGWSTMGRRGAGCGDVVGGRRMNCTTTDESSRASLSPCALYLMRAATGLEISLNSTANSLISGSGAMMGAAKPTPFTHNQRHYREFGPRVAGPGSREKPQGGADPRGDI